MPSYMRLVHQVQELSNLQWMAGIAVYYVQRIREGALPSEKLLLEKVDNCFLIVNQ